jgi:hypothetical protein
MVRREFHAESFINNKKEKKVLSPALRRLVTEELPAKVGTQNKGVKKLWQSD